MTIARLPGRLRCLFGIHERSRTKAKLVDGVYRSRCMGCGVAMRDDGPHGWQVDRGGPDGRRFSRMIDLD